MQPLASHSSEQQLLHQPVVKSRMSNYHSGIASLQVSTCVTCMEKFPGMTVRATAAGTECVRCNRDKNSPKAYSCGNNMHVPQELLVSIFVAFLPPLICYSHLQGLTQVEEMLISAVMPIVCPYTNCHRDSMGTLDMCYSYNL